ncbi:MAG: EamA family transporter [Anaerolineales bacterium]|nr:EamA family transporter [Anaerolineae bacterium]PWB56620.1 MAG: EamA family transporter [Anaerolineales bacterium]
MKNQGYWLVLVAACLWGTNGTAQALAPEGAQPIIIGTLRIILGGLTLLAFAAWRKTLRDGKRWAFLPTLVAAFSIAAYQVFFFAGVARTGVAVGTIVGIGSTPILAGPIGYLVRRERPTARWAIATALGVIGCTLLITAGEKIHVDPLGIFLAICAGGSYAVFTTMSKGLIEEHAPEAVMAVTFSVGALLLTPLLLTANLSWLAEPSGRLVILHLGVITAAVGYTLYARGLRLIPVSTTATLTLGEPLTAGLLGVFFLHEPITEPALLGILLIFSGLAVLSTEKAKPSHQVA